MAGLSTSRDGRAPGPGWHTGAMPFDTRRWVDPSQPQTLQFACWLLYANAIVGLLFGGSALGILGLAASVLAGYGIANEKRWGYNVAVGVALLEVLTIVWLIFDGRIGGAIISLMFSVALVALLLHPQSREYQKIWFS